MSRLQLTDEKIVARADLEAIRVKLDVTVQQAHPTLVSLDQPSLTVTLKQGVDQHVKTAAKQSQNQA